MSVSTKDAATLQVEVAVMVFREDLEGGSLPRSAIDAKVAEYRAKLIAESDSTAAEADRKGALARCTAGGPCFVAAQAALDPPCWSPGKMS